MKSLKNLLNKLFGKKPAAIPVPAPLLGVVSPKAQAPVPVVKAKAPVTAPKAKAPAKAPAKPAVAKTAPAAKKKTGK